MVKKIKILSAFLIVLALIFVLTFRQYSADGVIEVVLPKGSAPKTVAKILKDSGLITSQKAFIAMVKLFNCSKHLKAGVYEFNAKDNMYTIMTKIKNGENKNIKITVPEGFDIKKIGWLLEEKQICNAVDFVNFATDKNMEGYLFPDTYFIMPHASPAEIVSLMNDEFNKFWIRDFDGRARETNISKRDVVILASIVEKEAVSPQERPVIAGVFLNRLKKNMRLESCATVLYAMGINKEKLSFKDLKFESKYNTYKYGGLPPAPICNPGKESIKAVLYPVVTDNLYFVSKGNGTHYFSATFEEHRKNKQVSKKKAVK